MRRTSSQTRNSNFTKAELNTYASRRDAKIGAGSQRPGTSVNDQAAKKNSNSRSSSNRTALVSAPSAAQTNSKSLAEKTLDRWTTLKVRSSSQFEEAQANHDLHMLKMSKRFSKVFAFNVYKLNKVRSHPWFRCQKPFS
mgnify:CR=1 FL=1